jgi:hypothetical protein
MQHWRLRPSDSVQCQRLSVQLLARVTLRSARGPWASVLSEYAATVRAVVVIVIDVPLFRLLFGNRVVRSNLHRDICGRARNLNRADHEI